MKKVLTGIVLVLAVLLAGCGKKKELVIQIPLVTWAGYAVLFAANNGTEPTTNSLFYKYGGFKVKLVQEEDTANQLQGFANGTYQIIWSTMDMLPLTYDSLAKDKRTIPQVIGLFDFSSGGDGIIVRGSAIKGPADMKGKKIAVAQYTPSHFYILWYLDQAGLTEKDVQMIFTSDAGKAKDAYINDKSVDVCVTWSPFIYDITDPKKPSYIKGSVLLDTSAKGSKAHGLIADVYLARNDLVQQNPEVMKAFAKAMVEGYDVFMKDQRKVAGEIAALFGIKGGVDEVMLMLGDVVVAGPAEYKSFFDPASPVSAHRIFEVSKTLYQKNGSALKADFAVKPEQVINSSFIIEASK